MPLEARERLNQEAITLAREAAAGGFAKSVPLFYGYARAEGILAFEEVVRAFSLDAGDETIGTMRSRSDSRRYSLVFAQWILGVGEIGGIDAVYLDGFRVHRRATAEGSGPYVGTFAIKSRAPGDVWPAAARASTRRTADSRFTGMHHVDGFFYKAEDDSPYGATPRFVAGVRGRALPTLSLDSSGATVAVGAETAGLPHRILLDYLIGGVDRDHGFGPRMRLGEVDLQTFVNVSRLIETGRFGGAVVDIWADRFPERLSLLIGRSFETWGDYLAARGWESRFDDGLTIRWRAHPDALQAMTLYRYQFDGQISTETDYREAVRRILSAIPGAYLFQALDGTWKLAVPDPDAIDVGGISDFDLLTRPSIEYPDARARLNAAVGEFVSVPDEFGDATARWPAIGSFAARKLRDEDGGVELVARERLYGCSNRHHAASRLATRVLLSRRPTYQWRNALRGLRYEPGDVVRFGPDVRGLAGRRVRVDQVQLTADNQVAIRAIEFHPLDFDLQVFEPANVEPPIARAGPDQSVAAAASVTLDGSASSDPERQPLEFAWAQVSGSTVTLRDAALVLATFDAPSANTASTLVFRLTVTDHGGLTATDDVTVNVAAR